MLMQLDDIIIIICFVCGWFHSKWDVHVFVWLHASVVLPYCGAFHPLALWHQTGRSLLDWTNPTSPQLVLSDRLIKNIGHTPPLTKAHDRATCNSAVYQFCIARIS